MAEMHRPDPEDATARLVALGRDREAARLQAEQRNRATSLGGNTVDTQTQLDAILPALLEVADHITPDQLDAASPCAKFTVRDVLAHMIGGAGFFAAQLRGEGVPEPPPEGADLTGDDPIATFRAAIEAVGAAAAQPGAPARTIVTPFGEMTGEQATRYLAFDGMVHTWDLARATGQVYAPPEPLAADVLAIARQVVTPAMRDGDTFAEANPAPAGASSLEQLIAFTGRSL